MTKSILSFILTASYCSAASVGVTGGFALDLRGNSIGTMPEIGDIYIIVASTQNNTFEQILTNDSLTVNSTVGGNDDIVIATGTIQSTGASTVGLQAAFSGVTVSDTDPSQLSGGDMYALVWFDGVTSTGPVAENSIYGRAFNSDWVMPTTGVESRTDITGSPTANFTVQAVPEPSSTALLGLGALALIGRRKRA